MTLQKSQSISSKVEEAEAGWSKTQDVVGTDEDFGGTENRKIMERKLLRKLDARMSILIIIYILNYVRLCLSLWRTSNLLATT